MKNSIKGKRNRFFYRFYSFEMSNALPEISKKSIDPIISKKIRNLIRIYFSDNQTTDLLEEQRKLVDAHARRSAFLRSKMDAVLDQLDQTEKDLENEKSKVSELLEIIRQKDQKILDLERQVSPLTDEIESFEVRLSQ